QPRSDSELLPSTLREPAMRLAGVTDRDDHRVSQHIPVEAEEEVDLKLLPPRGVEAPDRLDPDEDRHREDEVKESEGEAGREVDEDSGQEARSLDAPPARDPGDRGREEAPQVPV